MQRANAFAIHLVRICCWLNFYFCRGKVPKSSSSSSVQHNIHQTCLIGRRLRSDGCCLAMEQIFSERAANLYQQPECIFHTQTGTVSLQDEKLYTQNGEWGMIITPENHMKINCKYAAGNNCVTTAGEFKGRGHWLGRGGGESRCV